MRDTVAAVKNKGNAAFTSDSNAEYFLLQHLKDFGTKEVLKYLRKGDVHSAAYLSSEVYGLDPARLEQIEPKLIEGLGKMFKEGNVSSIDATEAFGLKQKMTPIVLELTKTHLEEGNTDIAPEYIKEFNLEIGELKQAGLRGMEAAIKKGDVETASSIADILHLKLEDKAPLKLPQFERVRELMAAVVKADVPAQTVLGACQRLNIEPEEAKTILLYLMKTCGGRDMVHLVNEFNLGSDDIKQFLPGLTIGLLNTDHSADTYKFIVDDLRKTISELPFKQEDVEQTISIRIIQLLNTDNGVGYAIYLNNTLLQSTSNEVKSAALKKIEELVKSHRLREAGNLLYGFNLASDDKDFLDLLRRLDVASSLPGKRQR